MSAIYLFDWGNTLMIDFKDSDGKMCNWPHVQAVDGAQEVLQHLSRQYPVYVASNAVDSNARDIEQALARVALAHYVTGYFCQSGLGISKQDPAFYHAIAANLALEPAQITMVGDNYATDIQPALKAGLKVIWLTTSHHAVEMEPDLRIGNLRALC